MGPGLFGHMGLHQWGCWETKPGGETKAPSPSAPAMAGGDIPSPGPAGFPACAAHWDNWDNTGQHRSVRHRPQHGTGCSSTPCTALSRDGGSKSLFHHFQPFSFSCRAEWQVVGTSLVLLPAVQTSLLGIASLFPNSPGSSSLANTLRPPNASHFPPATFLTRFPPLHTIVCSFPIPALLLAAGSISHRAGVSGELHSTIWL